jgi:hypothetical protein
MHIERNVSNNVSKYLFSKRNTTKVHKDVEEVGVKQHLWLHHDPMKGVNFLKPHAPCVCT